MSTRPTGELKVGYIDIIMDHTIDTEDTEDHLEFRLIFCSLVHLLDVLSVYKSIDIRVDTSVDTSVYVSVGTSSTFHPGIVTDDI